MSGKGQEFLDKLATKLREQEEPAPSAVAQTNGHGRRGGLIHRHRHVAVDPGTAPTDEMVIEKCRSAGNAEKFSDLFDRGDVHKYHGGDDSDADFALLGILKLYTQDPEQLERLMRRSALKRPKWNEGRAGRSWLRYSIDNSLKDIGEVYDWGRKDGRRSLSSRHPPLGVPSDDDTSGSGSGSPNSNGTGTARRVRLTSTSFADMPPPEPRRYLVEGIVPEAYPTMIYGDGGVAKSMLALSLGLGVAAGAGTWLGRSIEEGGVLYLDFELDAAEQNRRVTRLANSEGLGKPPKRLRYMSAVGVRARDAFEDALVECEEYGIKLLIVDSLGPALEGDAEASRDVISFYNEVVGPFRTAGVAPLVIDHQSKMQAGERYQNKRAFGSVFKSNLARSVLQVEATERSDEGLTVRIRQNKHNFGPLLKPFGAKLTFSEEMVRIEAVELGDADLAEEGTLNARERVYRAVRGFEDEEGTRSDVVAATGLADGTVKKEIAALKHEEPPRVWDTGRVYDRQAVVTTKTPAGSGSDIYKGTGTGTGSVLSETKALDALRKGNGPRKALEHYRNGDQDFESVAKSVLHFWSKDPGRWREAASNVLTAISRLDEEEEGLL